MHHIYHTIYWSEGERRSVPPNGKLPELVCESDGKASVVGPRFGRRGGCPGFHFLHPAVTDIGGRPEGGRRGVGRDFAEILL